MRIAQGPAEFLERRLGLTVSGAGLLGTSAIGWLIAFSLGSRAMFLLVYGTLLVGAFSWVLGRRRLGIQARRSDLPARVREGQAVEVELELRAGRRISTVILEEALHTQLGTAVRIPVPHLSGGQAINHTYTFVPKLRGVYKVGPLVASWSDPFGLTKRRVPLVEPAEIIVHPSTELVHDRVLTREWEDPPIRPPIFKPWPTGFEFYGLRDYVSGDDPRRIVWRATARTLDPVTGAGRYLVREAEQGITDSVSLILDTDGKFHSPGNPSDTFETAVKLVASLGMRHLTDGFGVTLEANGSRLADALRSKRYRTRLLDALARVQRERVPLTRVLERLVADPRRETHMVFVTPHIDESAAGRIRLLLDRGALVLIAMIVWDDTDPQSMHRAGALGANVVKVNPGDPLEKVFRGVVGSSLRR